MQIASLRDLKLDSTSSSVTGDMVERFHGVYDYAPQGPPSFHSMVLVLINDLFVE